MVNHRIYSKLNYTLKALSKWKRKHFGYAHHQIKSLEVDLEKCISKGLSRSQRCRKGGRGIKRTPKTDWAHVLFSKNTYVRTCNLINDIIVLKDLNYDLFYLGSNLFFGWNKIKEICKQQDSVQRRLEGCQAHYCSKMGKATLIWYAIHAIPVYFIAAF